MRNTLDVCLLITLATVATGLTGCIGLTLPTGDGPVTSAGYLGDRAALPLGEIIVSVPGTSDATAYRNLHVHLAAVINPVSISTSDPDDVERVIVRTQTRLQARILESVLTSPPGGTSELGALRTRLAAEAQAQFDEVFTRWKFASAYRVELVVTSMFFTNGAVGRQEQRRWWF